MTPTESGASRADAERTDVAATPAAVLPASRADARDAAGRSAAQRGADDHDGSGRDAIAREVTARDVLAFSRAREALRSLSREERRALTEAQVAATRPIVAGVVMSGALVLAVALAFELAGLIPGIGYPTYVTGGGVAIAMACALGIVRVRQWQPRLLLTLLATAAIGTLLSLPPPGVAAQLAIRTALFHLMPIALLALLARRTSIAAVAVLVVGMAALRTTVHGDPVGGWALYWLFILTSLAFGLLLGAYRVVFAVTAFRAQMRLHEQATTDPLTGLLNRSGWNRRAASLHARATASGGPLGLVFLDIDRFKAVNDTLGHDAGDDILRMLGRILLQRGGAGGCAARLGGEEFVVLSAEAPEAVEGFVERVRREFHASAAPLTVTVSAGIAHRRPGETLGEQLRRADRALYRAKAAGRDRIEVDAADAAPAG